MVLSLFNYMCFKPVYIIFYEKKKYLTCGSVSHITSVCMFFMIDKWICSRAILQFLYSTNSRKDCKKK